VTTYTNLQARIAALRMCLAGMIPTQLSPAATSEEIECLRGDLEVIARKVDRVFSEYGRYLNAHSVTQVDQSLFDSPLKDAIDGNALYEIKRAAEAVNEYEAEEEYAEAV